MKPIYSYEMEDINGETVEIFVYEDDTAAVRFYNYDLGTESVKAFQNESSAYNWAYKRGYRE